MASQAAPMDRKAAIRLLGGNPRLHTLRFIVKLTAGGMLVTGMLIATGVILDWWVLGLIGVLLGAVGTLLVPVVLVTLFLSLIPGGHFKQAVAAVQAGDLAVSWLFYGLGTGMVVVDEPGRRLFINGSIHGFDEVKEIEWTTSGRPANLRIVLSSGAMPVQTVPLRSSDDASSVGHRLHNALCSAG